MSRVRITKEFDFEASHSLRGYDGKCSHIHGHSYKLEVTVLGTPEQVTASSKRGMVIDFTDLKEIVNECIISRFDHSLILEHDAPLIYELARAYGNVVAVDFQPTCENLVTHFAMLIKDNLPAGVELFSVKLWETKSSSATWQVDDNTIEE